ncbi:putative transposase-like protein [Orchesella cincta]|uniref:Putative transposase-like protein n=1 Tax=Orchesella cincta TaxID=48709 RepID=A0A1D2MHB9_ORCCI|nr:putative transposase-like protein [Orchesella cincta]
MTIGFAYVTIVSATVMVRLEYRAAVGDRSPTSHLPGHLPVTYLVTYRSPTWSPTGHLSPTGQPPHTSYLANLQCTTSLHPACGAYYASGRRRRVEEQSGGLVTFVNNTSFILFQFGFSSPPLAPTEGRDLIELLSPYQSANVSTTRNSKVSLSFIANKHLQIWLHLQAEEEFYFIFNSSFEDTIHLHYCYPPPTQVLLSYINLHTVIWNPSSVLFSGIRLQYCSPAVFSSFLRLQFVLRQSHPVCLSTNISRRVQFSGPHWSINITVPPVCTCGARMHLGQRSYRAENSYQGFEWQCNRSFNGNRCRHSVYYYQRIVFHDVRLPWTIFGSLPSLVLQDPVTVAGEQVGCGKDAALDWYSFCRQICYDVVAEMNICIGGDGLHVEIDETHIFKRKYNRGRQLATEHVWVFGGICRESKEAFLQVVPDRSGNTLWPIIQQRVHPGTIIMTDSARVYASLHQANRGGYEHYSVNHRRNFVDPNDANVHTNTVERQWGLLKGMLTGCMNEERLDVYLGEYIYRRQYFQAYSNLERRTTGKLFKIFLNHVKDMFPGV